MILLMLTLVEKSVLAPKNIMERKKIHPFTGANDAQRGTLYTIPLPPNDHPLTNGHSHLSDDFNPNSTKNCPISSSTCNLDYNPENTERDLEVYTEVKPKENCVGSNKAAEKSESKEKDLRTRMFGFLLGCLASLILAVSAACVQVCTYIQSDVVHDFITNGCLQIFTGRNEVVAKVMFLLVSVILSTGGVSSRENPPSRETPSRESPLTGRPPNRETSPAGRPPQGGLPAGRPPSK